MTDYHPQGSCDACAEPPDLTELKAHAYAQLQDEADQLRGRAEVAEAELEQAQTTIRALVENEDD